MDGSNFKSCIEKTITKFDFSLLVNENKMMTLKTKSPNAMIVEFQYGVINCKVEKNAI